ncbi:pygopus homolog 2 [Ornithorhynchus anatinus]|uniref:pygopus homolog 2 n=1 Tax=Ornithorhynchus anatinus TaxID=9258 RepID=UPI0010A948D5|nr:pygopus homolog 2 [Ornithorhynchus anatinus]
MAAAAPPHPDKLEGGVPAPPPAPPGPARKQGKAGLQMKSPEKKRRKSNTQGPAYSHLTEFAPPPTPMVDHLVASNPFEDDFAAPKLGAGGGPPFLGGPGPYAGFRVQPGAALAGQVPPGYGGGGPGAGAGGPPPPPPQALRRQPPPFPPNALGPAFALPPQGPGYGPGGPPGPAAAAAAAAAAMNFPGQPFGPALAQNFSPPSGQLGPGPVGAFGPMMSPTMGGQPPAPPPPAPPPQRFAQQPPNPFGPLPRPGPPPAAGPFPGPDFPPAGEDGVGKALPPPGPGGGGGGGGPGFVPEPHGGSPVTAAAVNGAPAGFSAGGAGARGAAGTPDANNLPAPPAGAPSAPPPPPAGLVYPCGACRSEVHDDQDAILCEASCQKWFHRECTGMTENAYGLLTTEASAVWACDFCLKTKEIQSVYIREGLGQLVAAGDG